MSEKERIVKATGVIGSATLLSRIFGYIRDMALAAFLGVGLVSDAFFVAFTIPNLLRRLFAEGSLTVAFVPVFTEQMHHRGKAEALAMAGAALRLLSLILVVVALVGIFLSPAIIHVVGHGYLDNLDKFDLTVTLTRIMFPYVFFICLVALAMGILNSLGHFAAPALAPVFLNISMIIAIVAASFFTDNNATRVVWLAWGVIAGGVLQLALQIPFLLKEGLRFWESTRLFHPALKKVAWLMLPAVFGASVYQINIIVGRMLATMLAEGSVTYLYYADRLVQFPLGVFAISGAMAMLPSMSRQAAAGDWAAVTDTFSYSLKLIFFISLPAMTGLIVLREPVVELLLRHGQFNDQAVRATASALLYYGVGLWAVSAVRIVAATFYALSDTRTPVIAATLATLANIGLSLALMGPLGHRGLALATSLASMINLFLLTWALRRKLSGLRLGGIAKAVAQAAISSLVMGVAVWQVSCYSTNLLSDSLLGLLGGVLFSILIGVTCYVGCSWLLKSNELGQMVKIFSRRNQKNE